MRKFLELIFDFAISDSNSLKYGLCKALVKDLEQTERAVRTCLNKSELPEPQPSKITVKSKVSVAV